MASENYLASLLQGNPNRCIPFSQFMAVGCFLTLLFLIIGGSNNTGGLLKFSYILKMEWGFFLVQLFNSSKSGAY